MIFLLIFALFAAALLQRARQEYQAGIVERHAFALFALRDELREAGSSGALRANHWLFAYLDSSIARSIAVLPAVNVWTLMTLVATKRRDERLQRSVRQLTLELQKPCNAGFNEIHERYFQELADYLLDRHLVVRAVVKSLEAVESIHRRWQNAVELFTEAPETSTLPDFDDQRWPQLG